MSFCEIKRDAALAVAEAVADKAELEKLDLNGKSWRWPQHRPAGGSDPDPGFLFLPAPRAGNALGEEGCEQLQEVLDSFHMAQVLASLR